MQSCLGCLVLLALGTLALGVIIVFFQMLWPLVIAVIIVWFIVNVLSRIVTQK